MEPEGDGDDNSYWGTSYSLQGLGKETGRIENQRKNRAHKDKSLWNMKVMVMIIITGALVTVFKDLEKRLVELKIRGKIEPIKTTALL